MSRWQIRVVFGLLFVVQIAFTLLLTPLNLPVNSGQVGRPFLVMVVGAVLAQPALIALWAGLAPQGFLRRRAQAA